MNNLLKTKSILAVMLFVSVILMLLWVRSAYYQWYDPELLLTAELAQASSEPDSMVLYLDLDCPCNFLSSVHIDNLRLKYQSSVSQYIWLDPDQWSETIVKKLAAQFAIEPNNIIEAPSYWQRIIKKTPTVILFNRSGALGYLGPVSSGLSCNTSNSFIDQLLENIANGIRVNGLINSQVKGCFCDQ